MSPRDTEEEIEDEEDLGFEGETDFSDIEKMSHMKKFTRKNSQRLRQATDRLLEKQSQ